MPPMTVTARHLLSAGLLCLLSAQALAQAARSFILWRGYANLMTANLRPIWLRLNASRVARRRKSRAA